MLKTLLVKLINIYQKISKYTPKVCRFYPTCSAYTKEVILKYGAIKGSYLGVKRILKCNPFCEGGYDPVK